MHLLLQLVNILVKTFWLNLTDQNGDSWLWSMDYQTLETVNIAAPSIAYDNFRQSLIFRLVITQQ